MTVQVLPMVHNDEVWRIRAIVQVPRSATDYSTTNAKKLVIFMFFDLENWMSPHVVIF